MDYLSLIKVRGNTYLLEDLKEVKGQILQLLNRQACHGIGYLESEEDKKKLDEIEAEVKQWLDLHLNTIPLWTEKRREIWLENRE